jgi:hypothetical protein
MKERPVKTIQKNLFSIQFYPPETNSNVLAIIPKANTEVEAEDYMFWSLGCSEEEIEALSDNDLLQVCSYIDLFDSDVSVSGTFMDTLQCARRFLPFCPECEDFVTTDSEIDEEEEKVYIICEFCGYVLGEMRS